MQIPDIWLGKLFKHLYAPPPDRITSRGSGWPEMLPNDIGPFLSTQPEKQRTRFRRMREIDHRWSMGGTFRIQPDALDSGLAQKPLMQPKPGTRRTARKRGRGDVVNSHLGKLANGKIL